MKTGFFLRCVATAVVVVFAAESSLADFPPAALSGDGVGQRGLFYESAQSEQAAAAAAKKSSSYMNYNSYPGVASGQVYGPSAYPVSGYPAFTGYLPGPGGSSMQIAQQSSEEAASSASKNQYTKFVSNEGLGGGLVAPVAPFSGFGGGVIGYPSPAAYPVGGISSSIKQSSESASASAMEKSMIESYQRNGGGALIPSIPSGPVGPLVYPGSGSAEYFHHSSEEQANSHRNSQSLQIHETVPSYYPIVGPPAPTPSVYPVTVPVYPPSPPDYPVEPVEPSLVPRVKCGYVRQCKTVLEPAYPGAYYY